MPRGERLNITVLQAKGLPKKDVVGHCDPYLHPAVEQKPDPNGTRKLRTFLFHLEKSQVIKNARDPKFDYQAIVKAMPETLEDCVITFNVSDKDTLTEDDYVGTYTFDLAEADKLDGVARWYKLLDMKDKPAGEIEIAIRTGYVEKSAMAICKWCRQPFRLAENSKSSCFGKGYHAPLENTQGTKVEVAPERIKQFSMPIRCKWCMELFTHADNHPKACMNMTAHAALAKGAKVKNPK